MGRIPISCHHGNCNNLRMHTLTRPMGQKYSGCRKSHGGELPHAFSLPFFKSSQLFNPPFFLKKENYLFLAVLGLHCFAWAFSSCDMQGLTLEFQWLILWSGPGSRVWAQRLWHMGLAAPWHVGSSQIRDHTHVSTGGFSTTEPPGKSLQGFLNYFK